MFIYNSSPILSAAAAEPRFSGLNEYRDSYMRFAEYFAVEENVGEHWKGIELVAWYWSRYHSN